MEIKNPKGRKGRVGATKGRCVATMYTFPEYQMSDSPRPYGRGVESKTGTHHGSDPQSAQGPRHSRGSINPPCRIVKEAA